MAHDAELDRLKAELDRSFARKQAAWQAQDQAWKRRSAAREAMNRAYEVKQSRQQQQESSWQEYQRVRSSNGPRIDWLNSKQETAYSNMRSSFERASSAHESRDGASAKMYAEQGHQYKAESQDAVSERRRLVQEIRNARDRHDATKPAFQHAKAVFDQSKAEHDRAKADHEQKQAALNSAKAEFERAQNAFKTRLAAVRATSKQRKSDKRSVAERAGVPRQYLDDVWVSTEPGGAVNIYFGGIGEPAGPGHGHYAMDSTGKVTYRREPFDPHGSQNFTDQEQRWEKYSSSESRQTRKPQTDFYFGRKGEKGGHIAINDDGDVEHVRDDDGQVLYQKYDPDNPYR